MTDTLLDSLDQLAFDHAFIESLPADPRRDNRRRQVRNACYSFVEPTPVAGPELAACSEDMLRRLDLAPGVCRSEEFLQVFSGNRLLPGMKPHAMCYGGHQFGHWAGQLGDGRAILLGDVVNRAGERWSLQLKGAGPTPYSRTADGLAVLRSSLREFVCSEAMHALGVPTTRALSLIVTGEQVLRDMFYDGNPRHEPGAVVCRVAPSFIRFGNFQILAAQRDHENLRRLLDFSIATYDPDLGAPGKAAYERWFERVCRRSCEMVVHWMRVGFVHGVMNTDNMSIHGLTIDYGPYGFLEPYDEDWTPNTTDAQGRRYRYGNQPQIVLWNLLQLAEAILPLTDDPAPLEQALQAFHDDYQHCWNDMMAHKLGFEKHESELEPAIESLPGLLKRTETDWTLFFRQLARLELSNEGISDADLKAIFEPAWYQPDEISADYLASLREWLALYRHAAEGRDETQRREIMNRTNPLFVFRNYLAQEAIDQAEQGDYSRLHELLEVLRDPYREQPGKEHFAGRRPEWARHRAGCSMLSCSS